MNLEEIARAGVASGNEIGARLHAMLGRLPNPQEFMAFYGTVAGTVAGNALSEIVRAAGKETGAQWLGEVLGIVQVTARRNGADIILAGGLTIKTVASPGATQPAAQIPSSPPLENNICPCEISEGSCRACERELDRSIDRFIGLIKSSVDISREVEKSKICEACRNRMLDAVLARSIRKNAVSFGDRLPAALEIFMASVTPQIKNMMPEVTLDETLKVVGEIASTLKP